MKSMKKNDKYMNVENFPDIKEISYLRRNLLKWFEKNERKFPWRKAKDPFKVLIAEMMLRRTKADQVKPVYEKLFKEYPSVDALAKAKSKKVEKILYPIGLKWRASAFGLVAREVKKKYHCRVPEKREELKQLPGVGEYVAGAVLSIGYGKKEWIVDSNIVRLFKRYFGIKTSKEGRRDKHIIKMAKMYVSSKNPRRVNLAVLDFTALICKPKRPECKKCPLNKECDHEFSEEALKV